MRYIQRVALPILLKKDGITMPNRNYTMYVSVAHQLVTRNKYDSPYEYEVSIPKDYVEIFDHLFDQTSELEFINFLRAHLPYMPYHYDKDNHQIDLRLHKAYALIHEFTDSESKAFIEKLPFFRQPTNVSSMYS